MSSKVLLIMIANFNLQKSFGWVSVSKVGAINTISTCKLFKRFTEKGMQKLAFSFTLGLLIEMVKCRLNAVVILML